MIDPLEYWLCEYDRTRSYKLAFDNQIALTQRKLRCLGISVKGKTKRRILYEKLIRRRIREQKKALRLLEVINDIVQEGRKHETSLVSYKHIKLSDPVHLIKRLYMEDVKRYTESNKHLIIGIEKRSWNGYHIDHIVAKSYGYKNNIPAYLIGSPENLQMLPAHENLKKRSKLTPKAIQLLKKWNL